MSTYSCDIEHLVELVLLISLHSTANISRHISGGTVSLSNNGLLQLVLAQVRQERSLVFADEVTFDQVVEGVGLGFAGHLGFAEVLIEADVEAAEGLLVLLNRKVAELLPQLKLLGIVCMVVQRISSAETSEMQ